MYSGLLEGLLICLAPLNLLAVMAGCIVGIVVGTLPGLSGAVACALLLPLTYSMEPATSIMMMLGAYSAAVYSASIGGVLYNIPGSASGAATTIEGFPMTRQGRANDALCMCIIASFVGGTIGFFALFATAPLISSIALKLGPAELFAIALFALSVIATLAGSRPIQGLISCGLGLLMGFVGIHSLTGYVRMTFKIPYLFEGVHTVWVILGIYAFTQIITMGKSVFNPKEYELGEVELKPWDLRWTMKKIMQRKWLAIKTSIMGAIVGAVPGTGGSIAAWMGYAEAKRTVKDEEFGNGAISGIIGAETANNAVIPGTLIPLITLGIPGSGSSAVILSGLIMAGLNVGPRLFVEQPALVWSIILSSFTANVAFLIIGLLAIRHATVILKIPASYFVPIIGAVTVIGAYVPRAQIFGVYVTIIIGSVFYVLREKFKLPPAPVLLGFILGPIAESNFQRAMQMYRNDYSKFFTRPISLVFILLALYMIFSEIIKQDKKVSKEKSKNKNLKENAVTNA